MLRKIVAAAALAALAACAAATPYQPAGWNGTQYGYSDMRIEPNRYRVTFAGNSLTDRGRVENYLLLRAAELTLQTGGDYFIVADRDTEANRQYRTTGLSSYRSPWGFYPSYSFYYPAFGWYDPWAPFGPRYRDIDIRESTRYVAHAEIVTGRGTVPDNPNAFDARAVVNNLRGLTVPASR